MTRLRTGGRRALARRLIVLAAFGMGGVLVADDEPHIGRIIKMKLEQGPFAVTLAYDGRDALEQMESDPSIALVLLDVMMPYMTGLDVLAKLRADERWRSIPAIVLTAALSRKPLARAARAATSRLAERRRRRRLRAATD